MLRITFCPSRRSSSESLVLGLVTRELTGYILFEPLCVPHDLALHYHWDGHSCLHTYKQADTMDVRSVAVIGAGPAGAAAADALAKEERFETVRVFDRRSLAGGTW